MTNETTPAHTPTPWYAKRGMTQMCDLSTTVAQLRGTHRDVSWWIFSNANTHGDADKDAAYIVTCVNSHAQLLAERDAFKEVADEAVAEMVELRATTAKLREALTELLDARGTSLNIVGHDPVSGHPLSREGMAALKARTALSSTTP